MQVRAHTERKWEKQHELLDKLYDRFKVGDEIKGAVSQFVPELGEHSFVHTSWNTYQAAEILLNVGTRRNPVYGVMKTREEAHESLKAEQLASVGEKGSSAKPPTSILRHVAGPEAAESKFELLRPLRKDESAALVEAARQYLARKELKAQKLKELRDGGINVPDSAIPLARDERLENILLVLPYIDSLLGADNRYQQLATRYKELEANHVKANRDLASLRRWRDQQLANAIDNVQVPSMLERRLERVAERADGAKTNGSAESGAANGRAEDPARPNGAAGDPKAGGGESKVDPVQAREAQPRSEAKTATG